MPDIDIDCANRETALDGLQYISAVVGQNKRRRHPTGVYFHAIPSDPLDGMASWDYETAEHLGYFKLDLLNNTIYHHVRDEAHLIELLVTEPPWQRLQERAVIGQLNHINNYPDIVQSIKPQNITDLAVCLALIRPGKAHLRGQPRTVIDSEIWLPTTTYYYKHAHAISLAASIVVQWNLLNENETSTPLSDP